MTGAVIYPASLQARAQTLYAAGWNLIGIHRVFRMEGVDPLPTPSTIGRWCKPEIGERSRSSRARRRVAVHGGRLVGPDRSDEFWNARRDALIRSVGLTPAKAQAVVAFDRGASLAPLKQMDACSACGDLFERPSRGRPRKYCHACSPSRVAVSS